MSENTATHPAGHEPDDDIALALAAARKEMQEKGGPGAVGTTFVRYLQEDDFHRETGLVREDLAPFSRPVLMMTALALLDAWKTAPEDATDRDLVAALSKRVYVGAALLVSAEEVKKLVARHVSSGGQPDEAAMRAAISERANMAAQAWEALKLAPGRTPV